MMNKDHRSQRAAAIAGFTALLLLAACSGSDNDGALRIEGARVDRPANPKVAAVRMEIVNDSGTDDQLVAVSSPDADASIHRSTTDDAGMASMDHLETLPIPDGETTEFAPGGLHVMLDDPDRVLEVGDEIELTLTFEHAEPQTLTIPVVEPGTTADEVETGA